MEQRFINYGEEESAEEGREAKKIEYYRAKKKKSQVRRRQGVNLALSGKVLLHSRKRAFCVYFSEKVAFVAQVVFETSAQFFF
jgi:hypothetical protein